MANKKSDSPDSREEAATLPSGQEDLQEATDEPQEFVVAEVQALTKQLLGEARRIQTQMNNSELRRAMSGLQDAASLFKTMSEATMNPIFQSAPQEASQVAPRKPGDCGCGQTKDNCGPQTKPNCCVELYISKIKVIEGQRGADKNQLELIIAVQGDGQSWGLVPGLTGNIGANAKGDDWVPVNGPIGRYCVPCGECRTITLLGQAMEVETNALGGRPEFGGETGSITVRCDCPVGPAYITVSMDGGGVGAGVVTIEVSARVVPGSCCGY